MNPPEFHSSFHRVNGWENPSTKFTQVYRYHQWLQLIYHAKCDLEARGVVFLVCRWFISIVKWMKMICRHDQPWIKWPLRTRESAVLLSQKGHKRVPRDEWVNVETRTLRRRLYRFLQKWWFWANYNISLTWILRPFGDDFPNPNHDFQWGRGEVIIIYPDDSSKRMGISPKKRTDFLRNKKHCVSTE